MTAATDYTLAELCIVAASQAFANEGEVLAPVSALSRAWPPAWP